MVASIPSPLVYVNDDNDDQFLFRQATKELGLTHPLRMFSDGQQALHYLKTTTDRPLLILCDINMPVMDGLELQQLIDADPVLRQQAVPFILFTAAASPTQLRRAYQGHLQGFHTKALTFPELKMQVAMIVQYWQACSRPGYMA